MTSKYADLAKLIIGRVLHKDKADVTFFDVITIAMGIVEHVESDKKLSGEEKKELAKSIIPIVLDVLVELKKISVERAANLKKELLDKVDLLEQFIDTAALLTNDPELINAGKWLLKEGEEIAKVCCKGKCIII